MDVYILRHGKAGLHTPGDDDSSRSLTDKGRIEIEEIAQWLKYREISFDSIATSPLERARETGAIIAAGLGQELTCETWPSLSTGGDPEAICRDIRDHSGMFSLLLVGHEPTLSSLIGLMISGNSNAGIMMAKGGLARIRNVQEEADIVRGDLQWLLTPKLIAGMRRS
ncbi:MAG TPA: phosphohistidine phosphatase SixA [Methanoregulaceae archaeon]|nr:phosphohistidine phosphatase SixA [Methanoregulaceae archaeon]